MGYTQFVVQRELSEARSLLTQVRSSRPSSSTTPGEGLGSAGAHSTDAQRERIVTDATMAVQNAARVLEHVTGRQVQLNLPTPRQAEARPELSTESPLVSTESLQPPPIAGPSRQQDKQSLPQRPRDMEEIGNQMSDLDLANRAPVRARRQPRGSSLPPQDT
ncbi:hypothetical protein RhiTH_011500 [Rhizoctonia solani]